MKRRSFLKLAGIVATGLLTNPKELLNGVNLKPKINTNKTGSCKTYFAPETIDGSYIKTGSITTSKLNKGDLWFNTTNGKMHYFNGKKWVKIQ